MVRRKALLALAVFAASSGVVQAQGAFPAPLPGDNPFASFAPPISDGRALGVLPSPAPAQQQTEPQFPATPLGECATEFLPLRQEAVRRGQLIKDASARHASAAEACKLLGEYVAAELKMLKYVQDKSTACRIPSNILDQLNAGHERSVESRTRVCSAAAWNKGLEPIVTDFGDPAFSRGLFKMAPESPSKEGTWLDDGLRMTR